MDRRDFLLAGAGVVAGAVVTGATAGQAVAADAHDHSHHGQAAPNPNAALTAAIGKCVDAGNVCMDHCLKELAQGDKSLGDCAKSVHQMLAVCQATAAVAPTDSKHRKTLIQLCRDVCADCEKACRKHEDHHAECKACAEACAATQKEAAKLLA